MLSSRRGPRTRCSWANSGCLRGRFPGSQTIMIYLTVLLSLIQTSMADLDPVKDFCRRYGHQTAFIDSKLYIDGGLINYNPLTQYPANYSNRGLLYLDLDVIAASGMPQLYANLTKNNSVPDVSGGILWTDQVNKKFYLFGGEYYQETPAPSFTMYAYDAIFDYWSSVSAPAGAIMDSVSYGAGVSISERGEGYYYGGWLSNNSVLGWNGPSLATNGLVKFSMDSNTWTNSTGPDTTRRAEGVMTYLPASDGGLLVYFGGLQDPFGNGSVIGQPMEEIFVYDILSAKWYTQNATGTVPAMRRRFCAGATWPTDQTSYNIYLYGGAGFPPNASGYDDVYVLSIPSFQWIKFTPTDGNYTGQYPHNSLTCNMVSDAQMLIMGGTFPLSEDCDAPNQWGTHGLDTTNDETPWQLYMPNLTTYSVPDLVVSAVGGSAGGGATKTAPANGWANHDLEVLMTRKASVATRTPTRAIPNPTGSGGSGPHLSTGAIAGIAAGGGVALVLVLVGCCCFVRSHRRRELERRRTQPGGPLPPGSSHHWSPQSTNFAHSGPFHGSPFTHHHHPSAFIPGSPIELSASPDARTWRAPDGVTYELVSPGAFSGISSLYGDSTLGSAEPTPMPKIDSEGRLWVPRVSVQQQQQQHAPGSPRPGTGGGYPRVPGSDRFAGYVPVAQGSPPPAWPTEPHELSSEPPYPRGVLRPPGPRSGHGSPVRDDQEWDARQHGGRGAHDTFYNR